MDDTIILAESKEKAQFYEREIKKFLLEELHLDLNSKTQIRPLSNRGIEFVGYIVSAKNTEVIRQQTIEHVLKDGIVQDVPRTRYVIADGGLKLRKSTVRRIKSAFRGISARYFKGELTRTEFNRRVASYDGLMQHCKNQKLKARLNQIYLHAKEVYRESHSDPRIVVRDYGQTERYYPETAQAAMPAQCCLPGE